MGGFFTVCVAWMSISDRKDNISRQYLIIGSPEYGSLNIVEWKDLVTIITLRSRYKICCYVIVIIRNFINLLSFYLTVWKY